MTLNVSVQYNGGFLRHYTVDSRFSAFGEPISNVMEEVLYL